MSLDVVLDQALRARDLALAACRRADAQAARMQAQSDALHAWRGDYRQRWGAAFGSRGAIEIVHCYQSFGERLDEALQQQRQQHDAIQAQCDHLRRQLLAADMRVAAIRKLIERRSADSARQQQRREQRQRDDAAPLRDPLDAS